MSGVGALVPRLRQIFTASVRDWHPCGLISNRPYAVGLAVFWRMGREGPGETPAQPMTEWAPGPIPATESAHPSLNLIGSFAEDGRTARGASRRTDQPWRSMPKILRGLL